MKKLARSFFAASSLLMLALPVTAQTAPIRMGQTSTMQAIEQTDAVLARQTARIAALEEEVQRVTGRLETAEFQMAQTDRAYEDLQRENRALSERLARLEGQFEAMSRQRPPVAAQPRDLPLQTGDSGYRSVQSKQMTTNQGTPVWSGSNTGNAPVRSGPRDLVGGPEELPPVRPTPQTTIRTNGQPAQTGTLGTIPASALPGEAGALFQLGKNRLISFDYDGAEAAFRAFLESFGDDPQAGEAHYWLGETLYQQGDFAGSARFFTDMLKNYPDDPRRGEALVKLARSLREVGETERACTFLSRLNDVAPNASRVTHERVEQEKLRSNCN